MNLQEIINNLFSKSLRRPSVAILYRILLNWDEIAGNFFSKHAIPYKFFVKNSELYLACDDTNIVTEVYYFHQNELKKRIEEHTKIKIKTIKTVYDIRKFQKFKNLLKKNQSENIHQEVTSKIPKDTESKIEKKLKKVKDKELKESLKIFFSTYSTLNRDK
jgi:hypothetical protein